MKDDRQLSEIEADARALLDGLLDHAAVRPDAADLRQRVRELGAVETGDIPEFEPVGVEQLPSTLELHEPDPVLAEINADARLLIDAMLDVGPPRKARPLGRRFRPRRLAAVAVAAAVLSLAGGALANNWLAKRHQAEIAHYMAETQALSEASKGQAPITLEPETFPVQIAPLRERAPSPPASVEQPADPEPPAASKVHGPDLATLDAQAYAALRAGRLDEAAGLFEQIVKRGGRSEYAELAFGELFALARRGGGSKDLDKLWRSYLKRFPKGRYADAAAAGLCRRAPADREAACWTDYLQNHPRGSARNEALRATER